MSLHQTPSPVAQRQVVLFYESAGEIDREAAERAEAVERYRACPDLILCPRCECVQDDESRCQNCGRHAGEDA